MKITDERRGFLDLMHEAYLPPHEPVRVVGESSAIGDYDDSFDKPGSSSLWVGDKIHLNREQVQELVGYLTNWLATGRLQ